MAGRCSSNRYVFTLVDSSTWCMYGTGSHSQNATCEQLLLKKLSDVETPHEQWYDSDDALSSDKLRTCDAGSENERAITWIGLACRFRSGSRVVVGMTRLAELNLKGSDKLRGQKSKHVQRHVGV